MKYLKYGKKEIEYLKSKDKKLGKVIDRMEFIKREVNHDVFNSLISSIISQQISTKAAITVEERLIEKLGDITQDSIYKADIEDIRQCGMSMRKAEYIKGIAKAATYKTVDFDNLYKLSDGEIVKELIKLKGVGEWTAQMMLIHTFERPDVLSYKDLGIRRGIMRVYDLEDEISKEEFELYRERYSPYGTVASIYLWEVSKNSKVI